MSSAPDNPEIVSSRVFDTPRETVFRAFTDPDLLARWWGPKGFTNTFHQFEPRPGGAWRFVMHGPDGAEYQMVKDFVEFVPLERIAILNVDPVHQFLMTMDFADESGGTRVTWRMRFDSPDEAERVRSFILQANEENFDRLQELLAGE